VNRAQALAIFSTMEDDKLFSALESVGVPCGHSEMETQDPGLESWNAREVTMGSGHGGMFLDRSKFATPMPVTQRRANPEPDYKRFSPEGYEDFAAFGDPGVYG
jgi:hypothetical protein